jgi:hypothetical protein
VTPDRTADCSKRTFDGMVRLMDQITCSSGELNRLLRHTWGIQWLLVCAYVCNTLNWQQCQHWQSAEEQTLPETLPCPQLFSLRAVGSCCVARGRQVKKWRRDLHNWDPKEGEAAQPLATSLPPPPPGRLPPPSAANARALLPSVQVGVQRSVDMLSRQSCLTLGGLWPPADSRPDSLVVGRIAITLQHQALVSCLHIAKA